MATGASECKQYCGMPLPLLTDLAVRMRIDPLAPIHGLREFVTVLYGPVMSFVFPEVQVKAYRNSVLYVNLVSFVDCSVLNWMEQKELRGLASDDRLFERIAEPGWVLMDFNNHFKCRMGREDLSHVQFNPKLRNLRPVVNDSGEAMRSHFGGKHTHTSDKTSKSGFLGPGRCRTNALDTHRLGGCCWESHLPPLPLASERLVMRKGECFSGVKGWSRASSVGTLRPCIRLNSRFLMLGAERRSKHHLPGDQRSRLMCGMMCTRPQKICHD